MPQGSSAWVWISIATKSSGLSTLSLGICVSHPEYLIFGSLIFRSGKLIIPYNKFRKTAEQIPRTGARDGAGGLRDRFLERRQFAENVGRHRPRRTPQDRPLYADARSDRTVLQGGRRNPSDLFRRGFRQDT